MCVVCVYECVYVWYECVYVSCECVYVVCVCLGGAGHYAHVESGVSALLPPRALETELRSNLQRKFCYLLSYVSGSDFFKIHTQLWLYLFQVKEISMLLILCIML